MSDVPESTVISAGVVISGRFQIGAVLGRGGQGVVYRATDLETGAIVALKILERVGRVALQRFLRESRVLATLDHPAIVRHVAHGVSDDRPFLVMEWIEGEDLATRLERAPLTVAESVALVRGIADALAVAHRAGIVHRDLKPRNLFLRDRALDAVVVLDFGLARPVIGASSITRDGSVVGTPGYMAPEQAFADDAVSPAADVFALGCILFECVTGMPMFQARELESFTARVALESAPRARSIRHDLPVALDDAIARMVTRDPAGRPRDADALLALLAAVGGDLPGAPRRPGHGPTPRAVDGGDEVRHVSVVLAVPPVPEPGSTVADARALQERRHRRGHLVSALTRLGAQTHLDDDELTVVLAPRRASARDQAVRAARCALLVRQHDPDALVVVATGPAMGDLDAPPVGPVVDRCRDLVRRGQTRFDLRSILIDPSTAQLLDARFPVAPTADGNHILVGELAGSEHLPLFMGVATPCVGRERELRILLGLHDACREERQAQVALVTGPPGMGKSRLRLELTRRLAERGGDTQIVIARGDPMMTRTPYAMAAQIVRQICGTGESERVAVQRERIELAVRAEGLSAADATDRIDFLSELCHLRLEPDPASRLAAARQDAVLMWDRISDAFRGLLDRTCRQATVVILLEDLQWCDAPSVRLFDLALRRLVNAPLIVLGFARPEVTDHFPALWEARGCHTIRLVELSPAACEHLVHHVLPTITPERIAQLAARSMGNPLYLEELMRVEAESPGETVPMAIRAVLESRFMELSAPVRRVLRLASVFGRRFWRSGVRALMHASDDAVDVDDALQQLAYAEIVEVQPQGRFGDQVEYLMHHDLYRDVAYDMLPLPERQRAHRLAAVWLESVGTQDAAQLAEHFELGGDRERAGPYHVRAAEKSLLAGDLQAALSHVERGLSGDISPQIRGELLANRSLALFWGGGRSSDYGPYAREAMSSVFAAGSVRWYQCVGPLAFLLLFDCELGSADELVGLTELVAEATPMDDAIAGYAEAISHLTLVASSMGARALAERLFAVHRQLEARLSPADHLARGMRTHAEAIHGHLLEADPWRTLMLARQAGADFELAGNRRMASSAFVPLAAAEFVLFEPARAIETLRTALDRLPPEEHASFAFVGVNLAMLLVEGGATEQADDVAAQVIGRAAPRSMYAALALAVRARCAVRNGDADRGAELARAALRLLTNTCGWAPSAAIAVMEAQLARQDLAAASAAADHAIELRRAIGGGGHHEVELLARVAEVRVAAGDHASARLALAEAQAAVERRAAKIPDPAALGCFRNNMLPVLQSILGILEGDV